MNREDIEGLVKYLRVARDHYYGGALRDPDDKEHVDECTRLIDVLWSEWTEAVLKE